MQNMKKKRSRLVWITCALFVLIVINIRVAAGISSTFERAIDGISGIALLMAAVYFGLDFFQLIGNDKKD